MMIDRKRAVESCCDSRAFAPEARPEAPGGANAQPPVVIRGLDSPCGSRMVDIEGSLNDERSTLGVHWITGTVPLDRLKELILYMEGVLGELGNECDKGVNYYDRSWVFGCGVRILWDSSVERAERMHRGRGCIVIPGAVLDTMNAEGVLKLCRDLVHKFWLLASRVDTYWDDVSRSVTPQQMYEAFKLGCCSGFRVVEPFEQGKWVGGEYVVTSSGVTLGNRGDKGCGKFVRVYDKGLESDGDQDCIRHEVEWTKERGREVMWRLARCVTVDDLAAVCGALVGGVVDWLDRSMRPREKNLSRLNRLDWWERILKVIGRSVLRNSRRVVTIERKKVWIERSVSVSLALLRKALGDTEYDRWVRNIVEVGERRFRQLDRDVLKRWFSQEGRPLLSDKEGWNLDQLGCGGMSNG